MNGVVFNNLPQLVSVDLSLNACIDNSFVIESDSSKWRRKISRNCASADVRGKKISCNASPFCENLLNDAICCELEAGTVIDAPDYTFIADTSYPTFETLIISRQQNVDFLPVSVHESFPVLKKYWIVSTPIQKLSKKNFDKNVQTGVA